MKNLRKKFMIDRSVQGRLAGRLILHWVLFSATLSVVLPLWLLMRKGDLLSLSSSALVEAWLEIAPPVFLLLIVLLPAFARDIIVLSNSFVGPMTRLRGALHGLAHGVETRPIRFRKGDFWKEVAADFNLVLEKVVISHNQPVMCAPTADVDDGSPELEAQFAGTSTGTEQHDGQCASVRCRG
jgi:hypothetical protein